MADVLVVTHDAAMSVATGKSNRETAGFVCAVYTALALKMPLLRLGNSQRGEEEKAWLGVLHRGAMCMVHDGAHGDLGVVFFF